MSSSATLFLGCPVWSSSDWVGHFYSAESKQRDWLGQYAGVFNTVEGNSTFYALPSRDTVRRWADDTPPGFRFSLKFPRTVSHELQLVNCERETGAFLDLLAILHEADRLGPTFLQLGPTFDRRQFEALTKFLESLPNHWPFAVEVRHRDYFDQAVTEHALDELLLRLNIDRVLFDSRALFSSPPTTDAERESQRRKPRSPFRRTVTGRHPLVRFIGRDNLDLVTSWIEEWAEIVAGWLSEGLSPYVFAHAPNDFFAPEFARRFHRRLAELKPDLPAIPSWPAEVGTQLRAQQLSLF